MYALSEALVLSHEGAPAPLWEPYLSHLLRPIKPLVLFGRDTSLQPRIPVDNAVWFGWKDSDWRNDGSEIHTVSISISISMSMSMPICICIGIGVYISLHIRATRCIFVETPFDFFHFQPYPSPPTVYSSSQSLFPTPYPSLYPAQMFTLLLVRLVTTCIFIAMLLAERSASFYPTNE